MNRTNKIVIVSIAAFAIIGVTAWYFTNTKQATKENQQQVTTKKEPVANDSKFATLKGEAFDEAYIADMIAHHEGAVNMAEMANGAAQNQELKDMAQDIVKTQSQEILKMRTWQTEWGYEQTMSGHGSHGGSANGMAGEMMAMGAELLDLMGSDFDKKFLELMIVHHEQAVEMSKYANTNASHKEIKVLATAVISAQEREIAQMKQWQEEWGYAVTSSGEMPSSMSGMSH